MGGQISGHVDMRALIFKILFVLFGRLFLVLNKLRLQQPILVFHRVAPTPDSYSQPYSPEFFENLLTFLSKFYKFAPLGKVFTEEASKANYCYITFDDATRDFYQYALPILSRQKIPFTQFVPTISIENGTTIWTYRLFYALHTIKENRTITINGTHYDLSDKIPITRLVNFIAELRDISEQDRESIISELCTVDTPVNVQHMNPYELKECAVYGELESHSHTHADMSSKQSDPEYEAEKSFKLLKDSDFKPSFLAYPFGSFNQEAVNATKKYYSAAFTTAETTVNLNKINNEQYKYMIPRITVSDSSFEEIFMRINGFHRIISLLKFW